LWLGVALWLLAIASWLMSWRSPHGTYLTGFRRYGIWCERGFVQARVGVRSDMISDGKGGLKFVEIPYAEKATGIAGTLNRVTWGRRGPMLIFGGWRPIQTASFLIGGEVPTPSGKPQSFGDQVLVWAVPYYVIVLALSVAPVLLMLRILRARTAHRRAHGLCLNCGYDLRATPERCPECGDVQNVITRDELPMRASSASSSAT
jgi:hypothetical protein